MKKKVLSTVTLYSQRCKSAKELLEKEGFEVIEYQGDTVMTADEIKAVGKDICGAIIGCDEWNEEIYQACPNLKAIGRFGVGYNNIDLEAAKRHGVKVSIATGINADSVAENTILLVLASLRDLVNLDNAVRRGEWVRDSTGRIIRNKVYGLVGFGAIARYVAKLVKAFGPARIIAYDKYPNYEEAEKLGVEIVDFDTVVKESDIISVHVPATPETYKMFGEKEFKAMKDSAVFVNVARGSVVDEAAMYKALKEKWIARAATDVFEEEPTPKDNPLFELDNIVMMPHMCGDTWETFEAVGLFSAQVIIDVMNGKDPKNWINK